MLNALVAAVLVFAAQEQKPPAPVDAKVLAAALLDLEQAFGEGTAQDRVAAMQRNGTLADPEVVDWIERGLRDQDPLVRAAAIETLRFLPHPAALKALEGAYQRDGKRIRKEDIATYVALIKAIGQHGSPGSIDLLTDDIWEVRDHAVVQARIYSLGNVRSTKSIDALFGIMKSGGRERIQPFMGELRTSLFVLTGVDQGESQDLWIAWWNDNKRALEIAPDLPKLPKPVAQRWAYYWGEGKVDERGTKRRDRGRD